MSEFLKFENDLYLRMSEIEAVRVWRYDDENPPEVWIDMRSGDSHRFRMKSDAGAEKLAQTVIEKFGSMPV